MIHFFRFLSSETCSTVHCILIESPRRANARAIVVTEQGQTMRIPMSMLKEIDADKSRITAKRAEALIKTAQGLVQNNRSIQRQNRRRRVNVTKTQFDDIFGALRGRMG